MQLWAVDNVQYNTDITVTMENGYVQYNDITVTMDSGHVQCNTDITVAMGSGHVQHNTDITVVNFMLTSHFIFGTEMNIA
jgi:hypothetical protein